MVKVKKYLCVFRLFVIFLTFSTLTSCSTSNYQLTKIEAKRNPINSTLPNVSDIETFIKPYRDHINKDLSTVLAYCPETLDKNSGKWQTTIGNLMADICILKGNPILNSREKKQIDMCILNHGGIRAVLPKGDITAREAYQIMPFENSLVVVSLKGETIMELIHYFIKTQKPQPLSGLTFTIDKDNQPKNIAIQGKAIELSKVYNVATNDYLANGGDNMFFFQKGLKTYDLDYKLRNVLIDYFKDVDTIPVIKDTRITVE